MNRNESLNLGRNREEYMTLEIREVMARSLLNNPVTLEEVEDEDGEEKEKESV